MGHGASVYTIRISNCFFLKGVYLRTIGNNLSALVLMKPACTDLTAYEQGPYPPTTAPRRQPAPFFPRVMCKNSIFSLLQSHSKPRNPDHKLRSPVIQNPLPSRPKKLGKCLSLCMFLLLLSVAKQTHILASPWI